MKIHVRDARAGVAVLAVALAGCRGGAKPDAYGNFESTEVVVSAEASGQLLRFDAVEGQRLAAGAVVGLIDTTQLALQLQQLRSQHAAATSQTGQAGAQVLGLRAQLGTAETELARTRRLYGQQAATSQQLDQAAGQVRVLQAQIRGALEETSGAGQQTEAYAAQVAQLQDRIHKSRVTNPISGTVLTTYVNPGELVQPGEALYRIADLDTLVLRAYVSETLLSRVRLGQPARVEVDRDGGAVALPGTVSWISSKAEFTPTPIQTKDERADLVYAVKIVVPNLSGALKIGMPADVRFLGSGQR